MLLDKGANPNWGDRRIPFHLSHVLKYIPYGDGKAVVKMLLDVGADPNKANALPASPNWVSQILPNAPLLYRTDFTNQPAVAEFEVQPHSEECLVLLDGVCDGDLYFVSEELSLLV